MSLVSLKSAILHSRSLTLYHRAPHVLCTQKSCFKKLSSSEHPKQISKQMDKKHSKSTLNFFYQDLCMVVPYCKIFAKKYQISIYSVKSLYNTGLDYNLSGLILIQTFCKDHQQMTKFAATRQELRNAIGVFNILDLDQAHILCGLIWI